LLPSFILLTHVEI
jgi:septal ring factor EnvC (AmiA/AmiB activator)